MKTPIQFRLNGEEVAAFVEGGANLLDVLRESSAISRPRAAAGKAPAAPAPCWSTANRGFRA